MPRIAPVEPPYDAETGDQLQRMMPAGVPPIALFRTFATNPAMTTAMEQWGRYELGRQLSLDMRDREIGIDRTCARCRREYEWGVHVAFFAERVSLTAEQIRSLAHGTAEDDCWGCERDRLLVAAVDSLHDTATIDDELHDRLAGEFTDAQLLDLFMLCGWYHAISFAANAAKVDLEPGAPRFDDVDGSSVLSPC